MAFGRVEREEDERAFDQIKAYLQHYAIHCHMYIQVPLVDHLRSLHKPSGSGIIVHGILRDSTTGSFAHGR